MSFLARSKPNKSGNADPAALVDSAEDRPPRSGDDALDRRLLPLLRERADWVTLQRAAKQEPGGEDRLLRWLGEAFHYQLVAGDPNDRASWRLTDAGEHRLNDVS